MTTPSDTMRAEFEAWALKDNPNVDLCLQENHSDALYANSVTRLAEAAFQFAWQASAEAERGRVIKECARWHDDKAAGWRKRQAIASKERRHEDVIDLGEKAEWFIECAKAIRALNRTAAQQEKAE